LISDVTGHGFNPFIVGGLVQCSSTFQNTRRLPIDLSVKTLNRPHIRARIFGVIMLALALVFFALGFYLDQVELFLTLAVGAFFLGVFAMVLVTTKVVPRELDQAIQQGAMENNHNLLKSLNVGGNGVYVPVKTAKGRIKDVRVFIPQKGKRSVKIPAMDDDEVFKTGVNDTDIGVSMVPPGKNLLETFESELGILFTDVEPEELEQYLRSLVTTAGLLKDINIKLEEAKARAILTQGEHSDLCVTAHEKYDRLCSTLGCPLCSSVLCALCLSTSRAVRIESEKWDGRKGKVTFQLSLEEV
jgi:hypothetical protein